MIKESPDSIMRGIKDGHGYVFYILNNELLNIQYQAIPLQPMKTCIFFTVSDRGALVKMFAKAAQDDRMYTHSDIDGLVRRHANSNNTDWAARVVRRAVLVHKDGKYGLISIGS